LGIAWIERTRGEGDGQEREEGAHSADPKRQPQAVRLRDRAADEPAEGDRAQTIQRIPAFIRPWSRSGVIAWRRLTWVML